MEGMLTENASSKFFYICLPHIVFLCQKLVLLTKVISTEGNVHAVLKAVSYRSLGKIELLFHWEKSIAVVQLCLTLSEPMAVALQAPLPMGFSRQEYWSEFPCPPIEDLPDPRIEPASLMSSALAGFFTTSNTWEAQLVHTWVLFSYSFSHSIFFDLLIYSIYI